MLKINENPILAIFYAIFKKWRPVSQIQFFDHSTKGFAPTEKQLSSIDSPRRGQHFDTIFVSLS